MCDIYKWYLCTMWKTFEIHLILRKTANFNQECILILKYMLTSWLDMYASGRL